MITTCRRLMGVGLIATFVAGCGSPRSVSCIDNDRGGPVECQITSEAPLAIGMTLKDCYTGYDRNITVQVPQELLPISKVAHLSKSCGCLASDVEAKEGNTLLHVFYSPKGGHEADVERISALSSTSAIVANITVTASSTPEVEFQPGSIDAVVTAKNRSSFSQKVVVKVNRRGTEVTTLQSFPIGSLVDSTVGATAGIEAFILRLEPHYVGNIRGNVRMLTQSRRQILYPVRIQVSGNMSATPPTIVLDPTLHTYGTVIGTSLPISLKNLKAASWAERPPSAGDKIGQMGEPVVRLSLVDKTHVKVTLTPNAHFKGLATGSVYITNKADGEILAIPYEIFVP